jgi:hypothetical protein
LLIFDHGRSELSRVQEFGTDSKAAVKAYEAAELEHRHNNLIDIVLVGSDSIETVKMTHANYFSGQFQIEAEESVASKYLAGL